MKIVVDRLWHGFVSLRDYQVLKALENKEAIVILCHDESMAIPYEKLCLGKESSFVLHSKHNNKDYKLIDFPWIPDKKQEALFQI